ncbi:MAG: mechanosensitive ion channel family protein, partial [Paracraurococcus sp.]
TPIRLGTPERSEDNDQEHYRAWRVRGAFFLNTSPIRRPFGVDSIGISFRHATLAVNNLMYVSDVIGMDLARAGDAAMGKPSPTWLEQLVGISRDRASPLVSQLESDGVLAGIPGSAIHDAFMSQDVVAASTGGDPRYIGYGKPDARFSRIAFDLLVKPEGIDPARLLPKDALPYIAIFAVAGAILARLLDRRDRGHVWRIYSLVLRLVAWPALLLSVGTMLLDYAVADGGTSTAEGINLVIKALGWIIGALLVTMAVERFLWAPLEMTSGRKIPTVFRVLVTLIFFVLAGFGIIAFVLGRDVTSLLATSGLLTFIIGLAIQSNLRDIFSGIMLNVERPFAIGDFVRINGLSGEVADISWRTTRLLAGKGHLVSLPNGMVVGAKIENLTRAGHFSADMFVHVDPAVPPERVIELLGKALETVKAPAFELEVVGMTGVENKEGSWAARYIVALNVAKKKHVSFARGMIWRAIWTQFAEAGLTAALAPQGVPTGPTFSATHGTPEPLAIAAG